MIWQCSVSGKEGLGCGHLSLSGQGRCSGQCAQEIRLLYGLWLSYRLLPLPAMYSWVLQDQKMVKGGDRGLSCVGCWAKMVDMLKWLLAGDG